MHGLAILAASSQIIIVLSFSYMLAIRQGSSAIRLQQKIRRQCIAGTYVRYRSPTAIDNVRLETCEKVGLSV